MSVSFAGSSSIHSNASTSRGSSAGSNYSSPVRSHQVQPENFFLYPLHRHIMTRDWDAAGTDFTGVREPHDEDLPLHMALYKNAPENLIILLIEAYPSAARVKGQDGYLPLHWACQMGCTLAVVEALLVEYPNALDIPTSPENTVRPSQTPRALARSNMNIPVDVKDAVTQATSLWVRFSVVEKARRELTLKVSRLDNKLLQVEEEFAERLSEMQERFEGYEEDTKALLKTLMDTMDALGKEHGDEIELIKDDLSMQQTQAAMSRKASKHFNQDVESLISSLTERIEKMETKRR